MIGCSVLTGIWVVSLAHNGYFNVLSFIYDKMGVILICIGVLLAAYIHYEKIVVDLPAYKDHCSLEFTSRPGVPR
jgi:hypothetical protein